MLVWDVASVILLLTCVCQERPCETRSPRCRSHREVVSCITPLAPSHRSLSARSRNFIRNQLRFRRHTPPSTILALPALRLVFSSLSFLFPRSLFSDEECYDGLSYQGFQHGAGRHDADCFLYRGLCIGKARIVLCQTQSQQNSKGSSVQAFGGSRLYQCIRRCRCTGSTRKAFVNLSGERWPDADDRHHFAKRGRQHKSACSGPVGPKRKVAIVVLVLVLAHFFFVVVVVVVVIVLLFIFVFLKVLLLFFKVFDGLLTQRLTPSV